MDRHNSHGELRSRKSKVEFPRVFVDKESDFLAIRVADGIEAHSFVRDGIVFSLDKNNRIIEVQILNLSLFGHKKKTRKTTAA
jgi:hypothetical protein